MNPDLKTRIDACLEILPELGQIACKYFRSLKLEVANKAGENAFDPVTFADKEIERRFRDHIGRLFPNDKIIGEEFQNETRDGDYEWVIDPIDGTRAFVIGAPSFATLITLKERGEYGFGVIYQPFTGELFMRDCGGQALWKRADKQRLLRVSSVSRLADAKIATTFPEVGTEAEARAFHAVAKQCQLTRYGMDAYAYALLASGQLDLVIEAGLKPFDYEAPKAVIEAAGGVFTSWQGGVINETGQVIAAATPELAKAAMEIIARTA